MMDEISIRNLQHYLYCPHRWGLIEIGRIWSENYFVVKAVVSHEKAHSGQNYSLRGKKVCTDVDVWDDDLGLIGKIDCIEENNHNICIVEYKPTKPKNELIRYEDAMQIYAQKLCADKIFKQDCKAEIYYIDVKKRFHVEFDESFHIKLMNIINEMRSYTEKGIIPKVKAHQKCDGCSMKDLCMPKAIQNKNFKSIKETIEKECML